MSDVKRYAFQIHRRPYGLEEISSGNLVMHSDYAKLEAEAKALREEVERGERHRNDQADLIVSLRTEVAALRARAVVDEHAEFERLFSIYKMKRHNHGAGGYTDFMTHCVFEAFQAGIRLNVKTVSEGLLRRVEVVLRCLRSLDFHGYIERDVGVDWRKQVDSMRDELSALFGDGKESGDA